MIKNKTKIFGIITSLVLIIFSVYIGGHNATITTRVVYMETEYAADFSDDKVLVGASHNIFIGKVLQQVSTKERGIGPETQFSVEVIENIKGDLKGNVVVNQEGGFKDSVLYVISPDEKNAKINTNKVDSYLLQPGSTYMLATRYNKKENWYTLNSYTTAQKIISSESLNTEQLKNLVLNDSRVEELKEAYKNEILIDADVKNNNTLNSYKSIKENNSASEVITTPKTTSTENNDIISSANPNSSPEAN